MAPRGVAWLLLFLAACGDGARSEDPQRFDRVVVAADGPLSLTNPQEERVTWPLWGGAASVAEGVAIRVDLTATGASGVVIAGPGEPDARRAIELVREGDRWTLRETDGGSAAQERSLEVPAAAALILELEPSGSKVRVTAASTEASLLLEGPLAPDGGAIGLYATLAPGAELAIRDLALSRPLPAIGPGTPLRQLAADHGIEIGSATDVWPPLHDPGFEGLLGEQFSAASPTELYWATTRGEDADFFFLPADLMINYAVVHRQTVTGMFLVWDFELPAWVTEVAATGDPEALGDIYDDHITALVSRYAGKVDAWVVVNEAIWGPEETGGDAELAQTIWSDVLGAEHIERAFRVARAADPHAVLLYNETGAEALGPKSDLVYQMVSELVDAAVPIDGVGLQFHIDAAAPPDMADVVANMERLGALGLEVHITELDVSLADLAEDRDAGLALQAELYAAVLEACLAVPACRSYSVFGFSDRYSWDELGDASPLLFDEEYRAKPAFFAIQAGLADR